MSTLKRTKPWLAAALAALLAIITAVPAQADETITYIHWDALGSPVAATDEAGNVVWREGYRPYGQRNNNEAAAGPHSRWYTGHPQDADTGLIYAGARYYDPQIGRFLAIDPVDFQEDDLHSFNRYAYAGNNPYKYVDPDGRVKTCPGIGIRCGGGLGASLGGGAPKAPALGRGGTSRSGGSGANDPGKWPNGGKKWTPSEFEKHHTIPKEIQKRLPPEVRSHPDVKGRPGLPNRKAIPYDKHREVHKGAGGGRYNQRFDEEINRRGGYENVGPKDIITIREKLVDEFGL